MGLSIDRIRRRAAVSVQSSLCQAYRLSFRFRMRILPHDLQIRDKSDILMSAVRCRRRCGGNEVIIRKAIAVTAAQTFVRRSSSAAARFIGMLARKPVAGVTGWSDLLFRTGNF